MNAVFEGYGKDFDKVDYNTPDYDMLQNLQRNVYQFSGAKNYQELKALTEALYDGDRLRTKTEFFAEAQKISDEFNRNFRDAEYDTAVNAAINAGKWQGFMENKDSMPLLKFVAVEDDKECPICKPYNNVIRPINDAFWKYAYAPLHFRCRCGCLQLAHNDAVTPGNKVPGPDVIPKMFRVNLAERNLAFPPGHPYYDGIPKEVKRCEVTLQRPIIREWAKDNLAGNTYHSEIGKVSVGMNGIKKTLATSHNSEFERNNALYKFPEMLKSAKFVKSAPDDKKGTFKQYHYLETSINDKKSYIVLRETNDGTKHFYTITDKLKKKNG